MMSFQEKKKPPEAAWMGKMLLAVSMPGSATSKCVTLGGNDAAMTYDTSPRMTKKERRNAGYTSKI
jgi:hypothetical protein